MSNLSLKNEMLSHLRTIDKKTNKPELLVICQNMLAELEAEQARKTGRMFESTMTVAMGVGIPAMSLFCAAAVGSTSHTGIQVLFAAIGLLVMLVSIDHLKAAIQRITGSKAWQAWALAIAADAAIAGCELAEVLNAGLGQMGVIAMCVTAGMSMLLNVYAFFNCKH